MTSNITESEENKSDLTVVHEAAKLIGHSDSPDIAIGKMLRLMSQMLGLNRGRVLLPNALTDTIRIRYAYGLTDSEISRGVYQYGEGVTGHVIKSGQVAVVQNIDEEPLYLSRAIDRDILPDDVVAYIAVPILDDEETIGVLAAHRLRMRKRGIDDDLVVMRIMASFIAQIIKISNLIEERTSRLKEENRELKDALLNQNKGHGILGDSIAIKNALRQASQVADTAVSVLLTGESGTGKDKFSRMIHLISSRRDEPFLAINCAAIPEQLIESELFGHERGAFTGAIATKQGKIELANGGTLFLDEIGDLDIELQSKLLRVLEGQTIQRIGSHKEIEVNVRIIAATHKNLQRAVNEGRFRLDLFYRLNVFPIYLPPMRERKGDIRILTMHFLLEANLEYSRSVILSKEVLNALENYQWPGNIRQLENVIKRAVLMSQNSEITVQGITKILSEESNINEHVEAGESIQFNAGVKKAGRYAAQAGHYDGASYSRPYRWVNENEAEPLLEALRLSGGNKTRAAQQLGLTARQYRYRMEKLGLN